MRQIAVYKSGDLQFTVDIPVDRTQVKSELYSLRGVPFEARDRIAEYALGQSNTVTYREWRWAWQRGETTNG